MNCECLIHNIGKLKLNEKHPFKDEKKESKRLAHHQPQDPFTQQIEKRCTKSLTIIGRGLSHFCTAGTRHQNLRPLVSNDPVGAKQIAPSVIPSKQGSPHGTIRLRQATRDKLFLVTPFN